MMLALFKTKNILFFMICVITLFIINTVDAYNLESRKIVSNIETIEKLSKDIKNAIETEIAIRDAKIQELQEKIDNLNDLLIQKTNENRNLMARIQELEEQQMEIKRFFKKLSTLDTTFGNRNENVSSFTEPTERTRPISIQKQEQNKDIVLRNKNFVNRNENISPSTSINIQKQEQNKDIAFKNKDFINRNENISSFTESTEHSVIQKQEQNKNIALKKDINKIEQPTKIKISYTPSSQKKHFDDEVKKGNLLKMIANLDLEPQMDNNYGNAIVAKIRSNNSIYYYIDKTKIMGAVPIK